MAATFPGGAGRWEVRRGVFRQGGRPHALLLVTDLSETLRAEERLAWQRLVRVLSHEINNSLAPIKTIAGSLLRRVRTARARARAGGGRARRHDLGAIAAFGTSDDDFAYGLAVVAERADALGRFIGAYARLSRLPAPSMRPVEMAAWVRRVAALERRVPVTVREGPAVTIAADPDQLDQLLINVLRNAADAVRELAPDGAAPDGAAPDGAALDGVAAAPGVALWWESAPGVVRVVVEDDGPGLADTANLFVPFYSTKPEGSGIGLALCRQIAEQHGGTVTLENRAGARGCRATVTLPR
jgi:signal transduction histidine kinase